MKQMTLVTALLLCLLVCFSSCVKNKTRFYEDGENGRLSIFSNTGNNVMTCLIDGEPWRTNERIITYILPSSNYEVYIRRNPIGTTREMITITWSGNYRNTPPSFGYIELKFSIPRNTFRAYLTGLQGQRMVIDSTAGNYFTATTDRLTNLNRKGNGAIYFQTMQLDSSATGAFTGKMSGIFEANFGTPQITKGRFDHELTAQQVQ